MKGYWHFCAISSLVGIVLALNDLYFILLIYFTWIAFLHKKIKINNKIVISSLCFFVFFFVYYSFSHNDVPNVELDKSTFKGEIVSEVLIFDGKIEFTFYDEINNAKLLVKSFEFDEQLLHKLAYGATCQIKGTLQIPRMATNPGQFDYYHYVKNKGIHYELILNNKDDIYCDGRKWLDNIYQFRRAIITNVNKMLSNETAQWLNALILGDRSFIDRHTIQLFQQWGLSHILAISGLHVGIIVTIIYFILVKSLLTTREKAQLLIILFLPFFALTTGGQPSVWRASLMVLLFLLLNRFKRKVELLDIFSIVFIILLVSDKTMIHHIGFQFSFLVTFGLLLSRSLLNQSKSRLYKAFVISFVAQMIILPVQLHYFYSFQPLSIFLNLIVIPYYSIVVIPLMFLLLLILFLPKRIIHLIDHCFIIVHDYFLSFLQFVNDNLNFPLLMGEFHPLFYLFYYLFFYFMMMFLEQKKRLQSFIVGMFLICVLLSPALKYYISPVGTVTMLDIGQGDAFLIELPYRKGVIFIDVGATVSFPDFEPTDFEYNSIIQPYLNKRSIYEIDAVFLSHEHADHFGSLPYLINDKDVKVIFTSHFFRWENDLKTILKRRDVQIEKVQFNEKVTINGHQFFVLAPEYDLNDANNNSLVLYTKIGPKSWLFTGDVEERAERQLIDIVKRIDIDILKVAHHGSHTSTTEEFLQAVRPKHVFIAVGNNNMYGHPAKDVINRLEEDNITIFRTDEDGAVQYMYEDNRFIIKRFNDEK